MDSSTAQDLSRQLRAAVQASPDYPQAQAEVDRLCTLREQVQRSCEEADRRLSAIWDREAQRLSQDRAEQPAREDAAAIDVDLDNNVARA